MRIHYIQHVPFEEPGFIQKWALERSHSITGTKLFASENLPAMEQWDLLVVLGGPMGTYEEAIFPWLKEEKAYLRQAIRERKKVLGICLGAQLLAEALGGEVYRNPSKEIGWFPVKVTGPGKHNSVLRSFPDRFTAFHWHGDTFSIPAHSQLIASSEGCAHQAFEYEGHVLGLQFHLEITKEGVEALIRHGSHEFEEQPYIEAPDKIRGQAEDKIRETSVLLYALMDQFTSQ